MKPLNFELNLSIDDLKKQKMFLTVLMGSKILPNEMANQLDGILGLYDSLQDQLVDIYNLPENEVFDLVPEEEEKFEEQYNKEVINFLYHVSKKSKLSTSFLNEQFNIFEKEWHGVLTMSDYQTLSKFIEQLKK